MGELDGMWGAGFTRECGLAQLRPELTGPNLNRAGKTLGTESLQVPSGSTFLGIYGGSGQNSQLTRAV